MIKKSPYEILGLKEKDFTYKEVKKAYRLAVRAHPPERDPEQFSLISDAYDTLSSERYFMNAMRDNFFVYDIAFEEREEKKIDNAKYLKTIFETPFTL